jgi:hypothetical protein
LRIFLPIRGVGYIDAVPNAKVISMVSATYVRDLDRSRVFYEALGFVEQSAGRNDLSAWSSLHHDRHSVLLVTSTPAPDIPALPLLFYFYVDDLSAAIRSLRDANAVVTPVGQPPHAPGGEARTTDPDGNTVLLGQRDRSPTQPEEAPDQDAAERFSLLQEAAELARQRTDRDATCQVGRPAAQPCTAPAEVKLADSWGHTAWACLPHADEVLINVRGAFIAREDDQGLASFLTNRHHR